MVGLCITCFNIANCAAIAQMNALGLLRLNRVICAYNYPSAGIWLVCA